MLYEVITREAASPENARTGINWRAIRLADVYLMYAEAVLNLNVITSYSIHYTKLYDE